MTTTVSGQSFVRTLRHYLDANEAKLMTSLTSDGRGAKSSTPTTQRTNSNHTTHGFNTSSLPAVLVNNPKRSSIGFPYMSLLAVTSSTSTLPALDKTPYMPTARCFSLDIHYLYFLFIQFDHLGLDVASSSLLADSIPPEGIVADHVDDDTGKAPSILSIGSVASNMSTLSLGSGWQFWKRRQDTHDNSSQTSSNTRTIQDDIVHIHQCLSRITALKLHMHVVVHPTTGVARSGQRVILGYETPITQIQQQEDEAITLSLAPFQQLSYLELDHIHPRMIGGWVSFAPRLISLVIKRAGIEDAAELLQVLHGVENDKEDNQQQQGQNNSGDTNPVKITFDQLQMLSLQDNNLTTLDKTPLQHMQSITHLNVSSNLLIDVPHSLSVLYNLHSLNLAYNMLSSTTGINSILGNIQELNLRGNRLTNVVGLDRLWALERLDVRDNRIEDMAEMTRLVTLPNLDDIWMAGNPFTLANSSYRVELFTEFHKHNASLKLDGTGPSFTEKLRFQSNPHMHQHDSTPAATTTSANHSPITPTAPTGNNITLDNSNQVTTTPAENGAPEIPQEETKTLKMARAKSKKNKRVIRLRQDMVEPSMETSEALDNGGDGKPGHVLRYAELQQSIQPNLTRRRSNASKKSSKSTSTSNTGHHHRSKSPPPPPKLPSITPEINTSITDDIQSVQQQKRLSAEEAFRRKIEMMRQEAGTGWLRVLQEMETNKEKVNDGSMVE
ncbi:hypothetical protein BC941DRAFT_411228 [Chlamydoabsidia padenii]|nr:hypothetical protein BC941DRAFT_411228 [Chlamydoabsidia padenii]